MKIVEYQNRMEEGKHDFNKWLLELILITIDKLILKDKKDRAAKLKYS